MPLENIPIGPFVAIYIGDYGNSDVLTQIHSIGTGPAILKDTVPETYEAVLDNSIQSGLRKVSVTLSFYGDDNLIINLSRRCVSKCSN